ncbi:MAG: diacylglycerol kinase family protein [Candidatus Lernaella stagnicola]|nr:diacylglycerol kinase family protein [Candidatus Lernaella stagnicola]
MKTPWDSEIAVVLNANAKRVTERIVTRVKKFVPESQLYISKTIDEGQAFIQDILNKHYTHVVLGGGDGTVVEMINQLRNALRAMGRPDSQMPMLGFLKLGTGNAWSRFLGMDAGKRTLPRMARPENWRISRFNLLETENRCSHFAGMGWDANILADYYYLKEKFDGTPFARFLHGFAGYIAAIALRTVPQQLVTPAPQIRVINQSDEVYEMAHFRPPRRLDLKIGDTLYEGPANVFGAGTTPYYGYNMVAYPFARMKEGFMNFRVVSSSVWEVLAHARSIFQGRFDSPNFKDYLLKRVSIEVDRPLPIQLGGDLFGNRDKWDLAVSDLSVEVFDFHA